jgi:hypothetical protein
MQGKVGGGGEGFDYTSISQISTPKSSVKIDNLESKNKIKYIFDTEMETKGSVDEPAAKKIIEKLNANPGHGIRFNENTLKDEVKGGTCTAVSLNFIQGFFDGMNNLSSQNKQITTKDVITVIHNLSVVDPQGNQVQDPKSAIRSLQGALNTIEVQDKSSIDAKSRKVQSLAAIKDLNVTSRSSTYEISQKKGEFTAESEASFTKEINSLPDGVYILRGILPIEQNKQNVKPNAEHSVKLEQYGHSTVFIHRNDCAFFFDPNHGALFIPKGQEVEQLKNEVLQQFDDYDLSLFRFYKIEDKPGLSNDKLLLLMNYKGKLTSDVVDGYSDEMVKALLNKNVKAIVKGDIATFDEITKLGVDVINNIASAGCLKKICKEVPGLKLDDVLKLTSLTSDQQKLILEPSIFEKIKSQKLSVDRFLEISTHVQGVFKDDYNLRLAFTDLISEGLIDFSDISKFGENQLAFFQDDTNFVSTLINKSMSIEEFLNFDKYG